MKDYLGDGVYVDVEFDQLILTTEDGECVLNEIIIEPEVWYALVRYVKNNWEKPGAILIENELDQQYREEGHP